MRNNKAVTAIVVGVVALGLVFAWLYWGSTVPAPTGDKKPQVGVRAAVHNTTLTQKEGGKVLWELKVGEALQTDSETVDVKDLDGVVYLKNGDKMMVRSGGGKILVKENRFALDDGVTVRLENGGSLKAREVSWEQEGDRLVASGDVRVVKDDLLATAGEIITSSRLDHFKMKENAYLERGGKHEEL